MTGSSSALPSYNPGVQRPSAQGQVQWVTRPVGAINQWVTVPAANGGGVNQWPSYQPVTPRPPRPLPTHRPGLGPFDNHGPGCDCDGPWGTVAPSTVAPSEAPSLPADQAPVDQVCSLYLIFYVIGLLISKIYFKLELP